MDEYKKYVSTLKDLQYPNISAFTEEEIIDLFLPKNKCSFLTWLINNLNPEFPLVSECSKLTDSSFADYFYETGFCTLSQSQVFVQRTCVLEEDIKIFDRIFKYLYQTKDNCYMDSFEDNSQNASTDDFLNIDLNLFSAMQTLKVFSPKERTQQSIKSEESIRKLKEVINKNADSVNNNFNVDDSAEENIISASIENFKPHVNNLSRATLINKSTTEQLRTESGFRPNFTFALETACNNIRPVLQYFNNNDSMKSINNIIHVNNCVDVQDIEITETVKCCSENSARVVRALRN